MRILTSTRKLHPPANEVCCSPTQHGHEFVVHRGRGPDYLRPGPLPTHSIGNVFCLVIFSPDSKGEKYFGLSNWVSVTLNPHHTAAAFICIFRLQIAGRSVLPKVGDQLQIRAGVGAPATLISAGKVMGTGDLCAKLVPPTLLFLAHA